MNRIEAARDARVCTLILRVVLRKKRRSIELLSEALMAYGEAWSRLALSYRPKPTPILWNHDPSHPVGFIRTGDDGKMHFHFTRDVRMTDMWFHEVFGSGVGYRIDESEMVDGVRVIKSGTILEYSL